MLNWFDGWQGVLFGIFIVGGIMSSILGIFLGGAKQGKDSTESTLKDIFDA